MTPVTGSGPAGAPLRLHPRVDVYHPLGEAHSDKQVLDALALYRRLFKGGWVGPRAARCAKQGMTLPWACYHSNHTRNKGTLLTLVFTLSLLTRLL